MTTAAEISERIIEAVMARKLAPGARLGEQPLAMLFDCSRTVVREALTRLAARGIVTVSARRGWYVIEPSQEEAREAFEARRVIETGLIRNMQSVGKPALKRLKQHLSREKASLVSDDVGSRSFLLGDFHVCLAECLGNSLLADTLRDFTARTTLIAMLYQSSPNAVQSCEDHVQIVAALENGDMALAEQLMSAHLGAVNDALRLPVAADPLAHLRDALAPVGKTAATAAAPGLNTRSPKRKRLATRSTPGASADLSSSSPEDPSTYLGALL